MEFPKLLIPVFLAAAASAAPSVGRNPIVRVVTISQADLVRGSSLLNDSIERLERAAAFRPDIACLPELFVDTSAQTTLARVTARLAEWARKHSSYLIFGIKTEAGGKTFNSAVLLDRKGEVVGQYDKMHPTEGELAKGVHPGEPDPPVFKTDFGIIGIQICFDVNWWNNWTRLKQKGAAIVFFPAAYPAARQVAALALANQFYVVSSTKSRPSRIHDITGETLAVSGQFQPWAGAALPLGKRLFEIDFHTQKAREIQRKYGDRIELKWYHEDDWFTLASVDPQLTMEDLMAEYGLTPLDDYRVRALGAVVKARTSR